MRQRRLPLTEESPGSSTFNGDGTDTIHRPVSPHLTHSRPGSHDVPHQMRRDTRPGRVRVGRGGWCGSGPSDGRSTRGAAKVSPNLPWADLGLGLAVNRPALPSVESSQETHREAWHPGASWARQVTGCR